MEAEPPLEEEFRLYVIIQQDCFTGYCRMGNFYNFPNFSFLRVSVSNISDERTCFFPFLIFPFDVDFKF